MLSTEIQRLIEPVQQFLHCVPPDSGLEQAVKPENLSVLLHDHLICELKAAQSAMYLIRRYAVDEQSSEALLQWLKPYEDFTYRQQGDWRELAALRGARAAAVCCGAATSSHSCSRQPSPVSAWTWRSVSAPWRST